MGLVCKCGLCEVESHSEDEKHNERTALTENIKKEVLKTAGKDVSVARIKNVEKLARKLEILHEENVYNGIPRLLLIHPMIWMLERWRWKREWDMVAKYGQEVLRTFGLGNDLVRDGTLVLEYEKGLVNIEALRALRVLGEAYKELGQIELAEDCEREAKGMFVILTGSEVGVEEFFA